MPSFSRRDVLDEYRMTRRKLQMVAFIQHLPVQLATSEEKNIGLKLDERISAKREQCRMGNRRTELMAFSVIGRQLQCLYRLTGS